MSAVQKDTPKKKAFWLVSIFVAFLRKDPWKISTPNKANHFEGKTLVGSNVPDGFYHVTTSGSYYLR